MTTCRHRHPAEWTARVPRTVPCVDCRVLGVKVLDVLGVAA